MTGAQNGCTHPGAHWSLEFEADLCQACYKLRCVAKESERQSRTAKAHRQLDEEKYARWGKT